jgi:hypothetical protein
MNKVARIARRLGRIGIIGSIGLAAVAGCGGGDLGPMSGHQALQGRDFGDLFFWKTRTLTFSRDTADTTQPEPQDLFVWPLDDAAPTLALSGIDWVFPNRWPAWLVGDLLLTGAQYERVYDIGNRASANVLRDFGSSTGGGTGSTPPLYELLETTTMRSDGRAFAKLIPGGDANPDTIVVGRPPELKAFKVPAGSTVGAISFLGADLAMLVRQKSADSDVVGVQRMDTSTGALTQIVAPSPASEWVGVAGFCEDSQAPGTCGFFGTIGCTIDEPACSDGHAAPCQVLYAKADPDATVSSAAFVHDVTAGTSTKLDGVAPDHFYVDRGHHLFVWGSNSGNYTKWWNTCTDARGSCDTWPGPAIAWRPDGGALAMYGPQQNMRIVNVAEGTCSGPALEKTYSIYQAQYSSGSDRLWWVAANDKEETSFSMWLADGNGEAPVTVATGPNLGGTFSWDGQRLYVSHNGESSAALGWVDVTASPPAETIISANRGDVGLLGNNRVLFVDHFNVQDGNGELVFLDLTTGARQSLARSVTGVSVSNSSEAEGTDVAYTVRGRAASSRDGLWLTTLPP